MEKQRNKPHHKSHLIGSLHNHWTKLKRTETKRKKEFLETWEKRPQTQLVKKKKKERKEKAEKYYTKEGTNYNHRIPNK